MFQLGKKVVCVKGEGPWVSPTHQDNYGPKRYEKTTVSGIDSYETGTFLAFVEYDRPNGLGGVEVYDSKEFRPLEDFPDFSQQIEAQTEQERVEILTPETV